MLRRSNDRPALLGLYSLRSYRFGAVGAEPGGLDALKEHGFFEGVQWETLLEQDPPIFQPYQPPDEEAEAFDWDLSTLASNGAVRYEYVPAGAQGPGTQHSTASPSSANSGDASPVRAAEPQGSRFGQQAVGAVSRLSSIATALDASSVDDLQQEISQLQLAEPMTNDAHATGAMGDHSNREQRSAAAAEVE